MIPIIEKARIHSDRIAIRSDKVSHTYAQLLNRAEAVASYLLRGLSDLNEEPIAFLIQPSFAYPVVQWGVWMAGGIAVPLCDRHPESALRYVLEDIECKKLVYDEASRNKISFLFDDDAIECIHIRSIPQKTSFDAFTLDESRRAMILYTSGTTSKPKGVVSSHLNIRSQITDLVECWQWNQEDRVLNVLPLHHVHGIINIMSCALWVGASCSFHPQFDANRVFEALSTERFTVFMAVPTIYFRLIKEWEKASDSKKEIFYKSSSKYRLMVSGSAALPVSVLEKWEIISGQRILERYGMTEIGMALSNPYDGERRAGFVGQPLPSMDVRLVDDIGAKLSEDSGGHIEVRGPSVFLEYWQQSRATKEAFTSDGWFKTGDIGLIKNGYYKILGRDSVDIIKSGGYKISALEIEEVMLRYDSIRECAVLGIADEEYGEKIGAVIVVDSDDLDQDALIDWMREFLPSYKLPRLIKIVDSLPKNTLGKVTKNKMKDYF